MNNFEKWILKKKSIWIHFALFIITAYLYLPIYLIVLFKNKKYYEMLRNPEAYADKNNLKCLHSKVVGVTFNNEDGTSRQNYLKNVKQDDELKLIPYEYEHQAEALGVFHNKKQIGNINADLCYELMAAINDNKEIFVFATPTGGNGKTRGCNITIIMDK